MKKSKKQKKNKVTKKPKMNGFLTALSVFAGVVAVSGATVFGVYLTGGFKEKIVMPESIDFEYALDKYNDEKGQLEISVDQSFNPLEKQTFKLKISTPTERVTKDEVTLSFAGQDGYNTPDAMGYISNTIIRLPHIVPLNQEFEVELLTENLKENEDSVEYVLDENGNYIDWIKGGITTIQAQSADNEKSPITLKVAVDVPVYQTETQIINSIGQVTDKVVTNESFTVKSKYIPAKSEYMFSDDKSGLDQSEWRSKKTFFECKNSTAITPIYEDKYTISFVVGEEPASEVSINGYAYQTAYSQILAEQNLNEESAIDYYITMLETIAGVLPADKIAVGKFSIGEANVGSYSVSKHDQTIELKAGESLRLFMNQYNYYANCDYLGVEVRSTSSEAYPNGAVLDKMLENVAIAILNGENDATTGTSASIAIVGGDDPQNYVIINGIKYYKPTTAGSNIRYSFWDLTQTKESQLTIKTILLVNDGEGVVPFESLGQVVNYSVNLTIKQHHEQEVEWNSTSDVNIMLDYDEDGKLVPETIKNLDSLVSIPSTNIYKDVIFFASFGTQDKESYKELADQVFLPSGYDYSRSGVYATENGNFTLFALEGRKDIALYGTGNFTLYFATIMTQDGQYQYDNNGLYKIAMMSTNNIRVSCVKSLNENSVTGAEINTDNFAEVGGEVSIPQGSDLTFSVKFTIGKESVPVFENEYNKDFMTPIILDKSKNDISSLFIIDSRSFAVDADGIGMLEYNFKARAAIQIEDEDGVDFGFISLNYNNNSKNITWENELNLGHTICVYKPLAVSININEEDDYKYTNVINGTNDVIVSQTLTEDGLFATNIKVMSGDEEKIFSGENPIGQFLNELIGVGGDRVVVTDQKGKTNTLLGKWTFVVSEGDAQVIGITADGHSFTFKNTNNEESSVVLSMTSSDNRATLASQNKKIRFSVVSEGVSLIAYSKTFDTYDSTITDSDKTTEVSSAVVKKYGAKGEDDQFIVLADLIKFYLADGISEYEKFAFKFNPQFLSENTLPDDRLEDLFGQDGMISLYTTTGGVETLLDFEGVEAPTIRTVLNSASITKLHIDKNFALSTTLLQFTISDNAGAINTDFDLNLLSSISIATDNYPNTDEQFADGKLYAGNTYQIKNVVTKNNGTISTGNFADSLYTEGTTYYVVNNGQRYILTSTTQEEGTYIATFSQGRISFVDFWEVEEKEFRIYFQPEGENYYALDHGITFKVTRDLEIKSNDATYYVLSNDGSTSIATYVSIKRKKDPAITPDLALTYSFSEYLECEGSNVTKKDDADFFFGYNIQELQSVLTISYSHPGGSVILSQIPIKIKLSSDVNHLYQKIANKFNSTTSGLSAQTQIVGEVEYLVADNSLNHSWKLDEVVADYTFKPANIDFYNNKMVNVYEVSGTTDISVTFKNHSKLLAGMGQTSLYMVVKVYAVGNTTVLATLHIPLIISSIGYESVVYTDGETIPAQNRKLETALTTPEKLYENRIYNEINAGELTQLINTYTSGDTVTEGGLYSLDGFIHTLKFYSFDPTKLDNYEGLIKQFSSSYNSVTLNHLNQSDKPVYVALEYIIEKASAGTKQSFYYLLKVKPDVVVEDSIYAYNGMAEYISGEKNELKSINLESVFDEKTLNQDFRRFNVSKKFYLTEESSEISIDVLSENAKICFTYEGNVKYKEFAQGEDYIVDLKDEDYFGDISYQNPIEILIMTGNAQIDYNGKTIFKTLQFKNEIASVKIGDDEAVTEESAWEEDVQLYFSADYSTLYYRAKNIDESIIVTIKHSYVGSANENDLAVIGGYQTYTLILNGSVANYAVRFEKGDDKTVTDKHIVPLENSEGGYELNIFLIQTDDSGNSDAGTILKGLLNIQYIKSEQEIENNICYISSENFDANGKFVGYDNNTGAFNVILKDYIDSDQTIRFAIYTEEGYLASLIFNLKSNAKHTLIETGKDVLAGGSSTMFADIFNIQLDGEVPEYTVTATKTAGDTVYADWDSATNSIKVADLLADKKVKFDFVLTFTESGNEYKFSHEFTLKANITPVNSYTSSTETTAGSIHKIEFDNLYIGEFKNSTLEISCESSSPAVNVESFEWNEDASAWTINTNYVSETATATLILTINIYYNYVEYYGHTPDAEYYSHQTYTVVYSFAVNPSVSISSHYPNPTTDKELDFEYVDDGATFAKILEDFFYHKPIFNDSNNRIVINAANSGEVINYTTVPDKPTIIISDIKNASLMKDANMSIEDNRYALNTVIESDSKIIFKRGTATYVSGEWKFADSGTDSMIEFTITYQAVSETYTVYILNNSLTVTLHSVSNFVSSGNYTDTKNTPETSDDTTEIVNYEKIYVDKTNTQDLFAGKRIIYAEMSDTMASYSNEYYLVFTDGEKYYSSYPIYFDSTDQSKKLYFDLGYSMMNKTFVGAYLASAYESNSLVISTEGLLQKKIVLNPGTAEETINIEDLTALPDNLSNFKNNLFENGQITLANRVQLIYGQIEGKDIWVDYSWYSSNVSDLNVTVANHNQIGSIYAHSPIASFDRDDGSGEDGSGEIDCFSIKYYFSPEIDIEVAEQATGLFNYTHLEVNQEYKSMASLFGVRHATNKRVVSPSDFATGTTSLRFEVQEYSSSATSIPIANEYITKLGLGSEGFKMNNGSGETTYLMYADIQNAAGYTCDYSLLPLGAKNDGDFLLCKITYTSSGFSDEFYVVVKIEPDYIVSYGESTSNITNEGGIISNVTNPLLVSTLKTGDSVYEDFVLTGEDGYISVKHRNGSSTSTELSTTNFAISMPAGHVYDTIEYNNKDNIVQKIFYGVHAPSWSKEEGSDDYKLNSGDAKFSGVKEVVFANQYYMIEGQDAFGFKYRVYFVLEASEKTPSVNGTITLMEEGYFDIGVQYQNLTIEKDGDVYRVNSTPITPTSKDSSIALINIEGIETWLFNSDYTTDENGKILSTNGSAGYVANAGKTIDASDEKYLSLPKFKYVTIDSINLYDPDNISASPINVQKPSASIGNAFATADDGTAFFNGLDIRGTIGRENKDGNLVIPETKLWKIPRLENTDIFSGTNTADVLLKIRLKYSNGDVQEYYDCPVEVNLIRALSIEETADSNKVVVDGNAITLENQFNGITGVTGFTGRTFTNDTLEVLVKANSTASFDMTLSRTGIELITRNVSIENTGTAYAKTSYISLSQYFGINVKEGDSIKITNDQNVTFFYYITSSSEKGKVDEGKVFVVGKIANDYIYIENADLLSLNDYYNVKKYYIMNCEIGGKNYSYQVARNYIVTGKYYKMQKTFTTEVGFEMPNGESSVELTDWKSAFNLKNATFENGVVKVGVTNEEYSSEEDSSLSFGIDTSESEAGGLRVGSASIDSDGKITLSNSFTANNYIKVVLRQAVSGADRDISQRNDATYHYLGTLNLAWAR